MRSKQALGIVLTIFLIATLQPSEAVSIDQERPTFVLTDKSFSSTGSVLKGVDQESNDSRFELIMSNLLNTRNVVRLFGTPSIDQNSTHISVNGSLNGYNTQAIAFRNSFLQKDDYIDGVPVNERIIRADRIFRDGSYNLDLDRTYALNMTYDDVAGDGNFTKIVNEAHQVDIFVLRYFDARAVRINDSEGNFLGVVYGFNVFISIHVFDSISHDYVAAHAMHDFGYGNMLPDRINEYLGKLNLERLSRNSRRIVNDTRPGPLSKVSWVNLGFNDTLGLTMFYGFYNLERNSRTIILPRPLETLGLSLNSINVNQDTDLEVLIDQITEDQQLSGFDDDNLESIDNEILDVTLEEDGVSIDNVFESVTSSSVSSLTSSIQDETEDRAPFNTFFLLLPIVIIPLFRKKIIKR